MLCIPKELRGKFIQAIKSGELDVNKLADEYSSDARRAEFERILGPDYGKTANTLFEKGLLAKDQQAGLIRAIKAIGLDPKPQVDFISKISKMDRLLSPREEEAILQDAREQKLGVAISDAQARTLQDLAKKMDAANPENRGEIKNIKDLIDSFKDLPNLTDAQKADIEGIKNELNKEQTPDEISRQIRVKINGGDENIGSEVTALARSFIAKGVIDPNELVDKVHEILKQSIPEITRSETMDAISGYGKYKQLSKNEIDIKLRDLKGQMQNLGKLEDMQQGQAPLKSGVERPKMSDEQRRLVQQVNEAKKKGGYDVKDPETQLKSALDSIKTHLKNQIADLEKQIATKEKIVREKGVSPSDAETVKLKAQRDALKVQFDEIFGKKALTDSQRISMANKLLDKQISTLESDLKEGKLYPDKKPSTTVSTPELELKRTKLDELKAQREELRDIANPKLSPEEKSLASYKARTMAKIAELQAKIDNGDFSKVTKEQKPRAYDDEAATLKADLERVKKIISDVQKEKVATDKQVTKESLGGIQRSLKQVFGKEIPSDIQAKIDNLKDIYKNQEETPLGTTAEFLNAQHEFSDYVNSLNEKPAWISIRDSLSNIYKNLFIGIKTGVKTATLGTMNSFIEVLNRRFTDLKAIGDVSLQKKTQAVVENIKMFAKTGVNTFLSVNGDDAVFGKSTKGHVEQFGHKDTIKGGIIMKPVAQAVNAASRGVRYIAIDVLHKFPMLINSSLNFVDALDITSSTLAKTEYAKGKGMAATDIYSDGLKIKPETELGRIARARSQQDTFRILNINNTFLSDVTMDLQRSLNNQFPTLGNYLIPMAKVPSSVISNQIENFGGGFATGTYDLIKGLGDYNALAEEGNTATPQGVQAVLRMRNGAATLIRTVGIVGTAVLLTSHLTKKDFYQDNYGNSYVRMGKHWLNTEAFGGAGIAVAGIMMGKTGNTGYIPDYFRAGWQGLKRAPVADSINSEIQNGMQGKVLSGLVNSYLNPILVQDIKKSIKEKSVNPVLVGSLVRTEAQKKQEDKVRAKQSAQNKITKERLKHKAQTLFGI